jgi:hypothetical protein
MVIGVRDPVPVDESYAVSGAHLHTAPAEFRLAGGVPVCTPAQIVPPVEPPLPVLPSAADTGDATANVTSIMLIMTIRRRTSPPPRSN